MPIGTISDFRRFLFIREVVRGGGNHLLKVRRLTREREPLTEVKTAAAFLSVEK